MMDSTDKTGNNVIYNDIVRLAGKYPDYAATHPIPEFDSPATTSDEIISYHTAIKEHDANEEAKKQKPIEAPIQEKIDSVKKFLIIFSSVCGAIVFILIMVALLLSFNFVEISTWAASIADKFHGNNTIKDNPIADVPK